jgi:hypothetical protein
MAKLAALMALLLLVALLVGFDVACVQAFGGSEIRSSVAGRLIGVPMGAALLALEGIALWWAYVLAAPPSRRGCRA